MRPSVYTFLRRGTQVATVILFCLLPWLDAVDESKYAFVKGSLFAFDLAGIPFADPVGALQVAAGGALPGLRQLLGALFVLLLAFFMGRVFCSWICPYGFFSELLHALSRRFGLAPKLEKMDNVRAAREYRGKIGILVLGLVLTLFLGCPVLNILAMPGEVSLLPLMFWQEAEATFFGLLFIVALPLAALLAEFFFGKRFWCRMICPQSVLLGLAARVLPRSMKGMRVGWKASRCTCGKDAPCRSACTLGLNPRHPEGPERRDCTMCGDCVKVCASKGGALCLQSHANAPKKKESGKE